MIASGTTVESVLLALKIAFLVLLYLFIWRIVRTASRDLRLPQESFVLPPAPAAARPAPSSRSRRIVVARSSVLQPGESFDVDAPPLFAVADGMGGAQAGEVASKLAAAALEETDPGALAGAARVASLIQEANRRVHERSTADPATAGMGTTMTVALVEEDTVV